jgi:hypothetical protein
MFETYQPSGRFSFPGAILGFIAIAAMLGLVAWVYNLSLEWIPFIILNLVATAAFVAAVFFGASQLIIRGKVRNGVVGGILGVLLGVSALCISHWLAYRSFNHQFKTELAAQSAEHFGLPPMIYEALKKDGLSLSGYYNLRSEIGWQIGTRSSDGGAPISGVFVYLIFGVEALLVLGAGWFGGIVQTKEPYCEATDTWMDKKQLASIPVRREQLKPLESVQRVDDLLNPPAGVRPAQAQCRLVYELYRSEDQTVPSYLTLSIQTETQDKNGNTQTETKPLLERLTLTPQQTQALEQRLSGALSTLEPAEEV